MMRTRQDWTRQEIAEALNWPINCVTGRVTELLGIGAVAEPGMCRINPESGKSCNVVKLTCWSCEHWRPTNCAKGLISMYPDGGVACTGFSYEPGTDEAEKVKSEAG